LQKQVQELKEKREDDSDFVARKVIEEEREIEALKIERENDKKAVAELVEIKLRQFAQSIDKTIEQRLEAKIIVD
jgi:hypothetical protein